MGEMTAAFENTAQRNAISANVRRRRLVKTRSLPSPLLLLSHVGIGIKGECKLAIANFAN